ncbi:MAG: hypothetical protein INR69_03280 [Mucilaginibacter polytrichastri]|nr:hypothetical protein [Mucilaginibacter polytrichastri]
MDKLTDTADQIVQIMRNDLYFDVHSSDVKTGELDGGKDHIHIALDARRQVFYKDFLELYSKQHSMLRTSAKPNDADQLIHKIERDFEQLIYDRVKTDKKIHIKLVNFV